MKIITWNIRGLGGVEKKPEVCKLISEEKNMFIVYLQETKLQVIDDYVCAALWWRFGR